MTAPNVLLLDEPTNDLDVTTLSILEDYLQGFPGPILVVSHDRFLLDKLAESIFEVRDGRVLRYTGNWSDWRIKRQEETAPVREEKPRAARPQRERRLKFSFKEQMEFSTIDQELAQLEEQVGPVRRGAGGMRQRLCEAAGDASPADGTGKAAGRKDGTLDLSQ